MTSKAKNIIIGVLMVLFMVSLIVIYYLITNKGNDVVSIEGKVIVSDTKYVIIESTNEDYLVNDIKGTYEVGDTVKFSYKKKNLNEDSSPKSIKIEDEDIIKKVVKEESSSNVQENNIVVPNQGGLIDSSNNNQSNLNTSNNNNNTSTNIKPNDNTSPSNSNNVVKGADAEVLGYFNELDNNFRSGSITESLKSGFITVVDFLFYNGTIKGYSFKELSDSAKLKVLSMAMYFDSKIESYFPGYKESISNTTSKIYTDVKQNIVSTYLNLVTSICSSNSELCFKAKSGFGELKNNFGLTWALIKDIAGDGLTNLKNWYEIFSGK